MMTLLRIQLAVTRLALVAVVIVGALDLQSGSRVFTRGGDIAILAVYGLCWLGMLRIRA